MLPPVSAWTTTRNGVVCPLSGLRKSPPELIGACPVPSALHQVAWPWVPCSTSAAPVWGSFRSQVAATLLSGAAMKTAEPKPVWVSRPKLTDPPPWTSPPALTPPTSLAFRCGTWTLLLTVSGAAVADEDRLSAVPLVLASELTLVAVLDLPKMKEPPVAATAVPDIAKNSAISEITIAGDGLPGRTRFHSGTDDMTMVPSAAAPGAPGTRTFTWAA